MKNSEMTNGYSSLPPAFSQNVKVLALESTLQQCLVNFKELLSDFEELQIESDRNKLQVLSLKNKCDSKICTGTEDLKKLIATKDQILQSIASSLTKLNDTKDWNVLSEIFKILFGDSPTSTEEPALKISPKIDPIKKEEDVSITEDVSFKEESLCEIEGTPGRTSPIIHTKKTKSVLGKSSDFRDKKKCPDDWPTPDSKTFKLTYPTPSRSKPSKLKQSRLNLVKLKQTSVVDLTCSPEFSGSRLGETVMPLIKKESIENDDTIFPSPTSGPTNFSLLKTTSKASPSKFKRPALSLKVKMEKCENEPKQDENRNIRKDTNAGMEDSINILNPHANRFNDIKKEKSTLKTYPQEDGNIKRVEMDEDETHCEINHSLSLLAHVNKLELELVKSPTKRPLAENMNVINTPPKNDAESSVSILRPDEQKAVENVKRKLAELAEPIYKEPTVRNKQEKRNLQGWSCEQCKNFYGELYKKDPVMLAKKINECSKHRGKHNPERPKTPPNFWNPRWHVPEDTEELNRMNNAN